MLSKYKIMNVNLSISYCSEYLPTHDKTLRVQKTEYFEYQTVASTQYAELIS